MAPDARQPTSSDEELLEAGTSAIFSQLDDEARVERVAEELHFGFHALAHVGKAVSIFGSARTAEGHPEYEAARDIARRLGHEGFAVITGGGPGIMEAANRGAVEVGAGSIGLGIELPMEQGLNAWVRTPLVFHYFFTRKVMFVRYASAFVVYPGGFGTLDELFEALTLRQTQKIRHFPIVLVGSSYWSGLVDWLSEQMLAGGKIEPEDVARIEIVDDSDAIVEIVQKADHRRPRNEEAA
ncbi:MAG: TIGR00730 family Rossman fold protein [Solirubrobacterales bacterium]|nr:TIGR00730 family Rossman fold protein [Solirubrobacterales bacterium]